MRPLVVLLAMALLGCAAPQHPCTFTPADDQAIKTHLRHKSDLQWFRENFGDPALTEALNGGDKRQ